LVTTTLVSGERVLVQEDNVARTGITQITPHTNHTSFNKRKKNKKKGKKEKNTIIKTLIFN